MAALTHFDGDGRAQMVDVSDKEVTARIAVAKGHVRMRPETLAHVTEGTAKKGDVLAVARLAGIMGAKRTADLIPLCHPLPITKVPGLLLAGQSIVAPGLLGAVISAVLCCGFVLGHDVLRGEIRQWL